MLCAQCEQGYYPVPGACDDCDDVAETITGGAIIIAGVAVCFLVIRVVVSHHEHSFAELGEFLWAIFSIKMKIVWSTSQSESAKSSPSPRQ